MKPVVIVGAGPAGLAVAAALTARGIEIELLDGSGEPGGAYREVHGDMLLTSPTAMNSLPGLALTSRDRYMTVGALRDYLLRYVEHHRLAVDAAEVGNVTRSLKVTTSHGVIDARAVVVASGMWRFPVLPEIPGLPATAIHSCQYRGPTQERTLVIGGGASAVEIAEQVATAGSPVWLSTRRPIKFAPAQVFGIDVHHWIKPLERALPGFLARRHCAGDVTLPPTDHGFRKLCDAGQIQVRAPLARFDGDSAHFSDGSSIKIDRVIAATGFRFDTPFLPDDVARSPSGYLLARRAASVSWPGLYVVGHPCSVGVDSQFLRGIAHDSRVVADAIARA